MNATITQVVASGLHEGYGWHGGGPFFLLIPLLWIAVIVSLVVFFKRGWRRHNGAEGVLRERYARGEISQEEFRERLEGLRGK
ncbi:MAG: SHOCT domain-containing protein [Stackebrandtia sp.]